MNYSKCYLNTVIAVRIILKCVFRKQREDVDHTVCLCVLILAVNSDYLAGVCNGYCVYCEVGNTFRQTCHYRDLGSSRRVGPGSIPGQSVLHL